MQHHCKIAMKNFDGRSTFLSLVFLMSSVFQVNAQQNKRLQNMLGKLATYTDINTPEKVYLQTDKDLYTNGETIWFKAYLLNGVNHGFSGKSRVVYVELLDWNSNIVKQLKLFVGPNEASGDITLPDKIKEGTYLLRAYTKYMMNEQDPVFFQKEINIWAQRLNLKDNSKKKYREKKTKKEKSQQEANELGTARPVVQFFPEGGDLVTGLDCVLGIKVTDGKDNGIALKGKILDQDNNLAAVFRSHDSGLGRAYFKVEPSKRYRAEIEIDGRTERYDLPKPLPKGYGLQIVNRGEYFRIRVSTNIDKGLEGSLLLGHLRGELILKQAISTRNEKVFTVKLLASKLQDGVAHFTFFAPDGEPVCERLIFIENPKNNLRLSLSTNRTDYNFRDRVNIDMSVVDNKGKTVDGNFSMSVVTKDGVNGKTENIKSWLLLNSDLGGTIADPNFFFQEDLKGGKYLLDMLMLTHGWRRFAWRSFKTPGVSKELPFPPEKGIMINGSTTAFNNRYRPKKALTTLNILGQDVHQSKETTNAQGNFSFGPFFFQDSVETIINAEGLSKRKKNDAQLAIYLDSPFPKLPVKNITKRSIAPITTNYAKPYLEKAKLKKLTDFNYGKEVTKLEEVVVTSKKTKTREQLINEELNSRTLYGQAQNRLFPDSIPWLQPGFSPLEALRLVAGVQVFGAFPNQTVQIRGATSLSGPIAPLFLLDGIPVDIELVQTVPVFDVLFIDVLKGPEAAIYGLRGGGGVVAIHTKRGDDFSAIQKKYPGVANFFVPGFYKTREFYSPNYAVSGPEHKKPDYRTTLHWEPNIAIKEKGLAEIQFFTGDADGEYVIHVEGVTTDGRPVSGYQSINVVDEDTSKL